MTRTHRLTLAAAGTAVAVALLALTAGRSPGKAAVAPDAYASSTIDLGIVVSDIEKSAAFYSEALGLKEQKGFVAPADLVTDAGLCDNKALTIRVFTIGDDKTATKLKLMQVPGTPKGQTETIHAQTGYRYLTLFVTDTTAALERLTKAGVKPLAKGPVPLPKGFPEGVFLTVVRDPDGNMVELVGPKK
jgi:lactoylglutathione lyase